MDARIQIYRTGALINKHADKFNISRKYPLITTLLMYFFGAYVQGAFQSIRDLSDVKLI